MKISCFGILILLLSFSCQNDENSPSENHQKSGSHKDEGIEINLPHTGASVYTLQGTTSPNFSQSESNSFLSNTTSSLPIEVSNTSKKISMTASIRFRVNDFEASTKRIEEAIKKYDGYISISRENNNQDVLSNSMRIKVSSQKFHDLIYELIKESTYLVYKNINVNDITSQYIDEETRLKTKKEIEKRYLEILKEAKTIDEILRVEDQIGHIREEIEAKEQQLKLMNDQIAYSTIDLDYSTNDIVIQDEEGFVSKVKIGIKTGWQVLVGLVVGLFYVWPFLIVALILAFLVRNWRKKKNINI